MTIDPTSPRDVEEIVLSHRPLARRLARRYARGDPELLEELEQVAALGLVQAARRFDPDRGAAFSTYAVPTILGELRRHFRATSWAAHVPRRVQEAVLASRAAEAPLTAERGRAPSAEEVAERLGVTVEEVVDIRCAASALSPVSLSVTGSDDDSAAPLEERLGHEDAAYGNAELRDELEQAMATLDPTADEALRLRFEEELTVKEVASRIGVSPSHASKLLERALATLRSVMRPQPV